MKHKRRTLKKHRALPAPGPLECHPSIKQEDHGCLPIDVLTSASTRLGVQAHGGKALRASVVKALGLPPNAGERSLLTALFPLGASPSLEKRLRPAMPASWKSDPDMWLDSTNIEACLSQWEEARPDFEFMGPYPIDFAAPDPYKKGPLGEKKCLMTEMCGLRVQEAMANGTKSIGIVYNLDPHYKSGSHWVANYIDIQRGACYYFDSYGMAPPKQISIFMKWLTTQGIKDLFYNARRLQYKNTECGVYCIYFIIRMLLGDEFKAFTNRDPTDAEMLALRKGLFSE
jgi:hypothetical protein